MCLYLDSKAKYQIAEKDIVVYKVIGKDNRSNVQGFQYHPKTLYGPVKLVAHRQYYSGTYREINEGFHSYVSLEEAFFKKHQHNKVVSFVIPAGTRYIRGEYGQMASEWIRSRSLKALKSKEIQVCLSSY